MESSGAAASPRAHVVLLASPGVGHLLPLAELARRLVAHHGLAATLVTFTDPGAAVLSSLRAAGVDTASLDDLPADAPFKPDFPDRIRSSMPRLRALLLGISAAGTRLAALVPDFFCAEALPLAAELGVPAYIFYPTNLAAHAIMRRAVALNDGSCERRGLPDPLRLSAHVSLPRADIPAGFANSDKPRFGQLLDMGRRYRAADGFLVNSFYEMEDAGEEEIELAAEQDAFPPAYPVGPLVRSSSDDEEHGAPSPFIEWLDRQPARSVVYVSFGSGGALSVEQTAELAAGLEDSGHRFLWVVRAPSIDGTNFAMGTGDDKDDDPLAWLPEGFLERTRGRGLAVAAWAPQVRVLSHPATAAFVSHCGWNSVLESVAHGVPMVAWPLYAEQRMNAAILSETVGVALRPRERADGLIPREEIAAAVTELMEEGEKGSEMRRRARELREAAARALAADGSSTRKLDKITGEWKAAALARQN